MEIVRELKSPHSMFGEEAARFMSSRWYIDMGALYPSVRAQYQALARNLLNDPRTQATKVIHNLPGRGSTPCVYAVNGDRCEILVEDAFSGTIDVPLSPQVILDDKHNYGRLYYWNAIANAYPRAGSGHPANISARAADVLLQAECSEHVDPLSLEAAHHFATTLPLCLWDLSTLLSREKAKRQVTDRIISTVAVMKERPDLQAGMICAFLHMGDKSADRIESLHQVSRDNNGTALQRYVSIFRHMMPLLKRYAPGPAHLLNPIIEMPIANVCNDPQKHGDTLRRTMETIQKALNYFPFLMSQSIRTQPLFRDELTQIAKIFDEIEPPIDIAHASSEELWYEYHELSLSILQATIKAIAACQIALVRVHPGIFDEEILRIIRTFESTLPRDAFGRPNLTDVSMQKISNLILKLTECFAATLDNYTLDQNLKRHIRTAPPPGTVFTLPIANEDANMLRNATFGALQILGDECPDIWKCIRIITDERYSSGTIRRVEAVDGPLVTNPLLLQLINVYGGGLEGRRSIHGHVDPMFCHSFTDVARGAAILAIQSARAPKAGSKAIDQLKKRQNREKQRTIRRRN